MIPKLHELYAQYYGRCYGCAKESLNKIRNENVSYYRHDKRAWWQTQGQSGIRLLHQLKTLKVWEMTRDYLRIFTHQTSSTDNNASKGKKIH